ncbi:ATP-binding protein [Parachlamydia sp. AcF125]|uniref:ATP-binding protein n=1 Tax=Parachlamydia sp. AcF125 TaxID=2795736 RepID=UPI001BC98E5F|nr:ATP-binding protein [Parachlamydia sp. AcF125]MBS4167663.1 Sensor protein KdpD [Parachlamydia sp. AcF125]
MSEQEQRPPPEDFLKIAEAQESKDKGQLKIFLGMAAGVGKTYTMLKEAHALQREGAHVVIGSVDTHGRSETSALVLGLKKIPAKMIAYRNREFQELDLDAILHLRPEVVLVDELAHTNTPGLRHPKRWQDVLEILEHGMDVYTTLNVQHIESLKEVVLGITGIAVQETVPDSIIEKATSVHLVDLTPDELLQRLKEGKIYLQDQTKLAVQNFFKKDKLTALREIVLRYVANKVDRDLQHMEPSSERRVPWRAREKFLVAVSPSPYSQKVIRRACRMAVHFDAPWIALYVNDNRILDEQAIQQLTYNLQLARNLGAEVVTIKNPSLSEAIQSIVRQRGVTQILLGHSLEKKLFGTATYFSLPDLLAAECPEVDIHILRKDKDASYSKKISFFPFFKVPWMSYIWVFGLAGLLNLANFFLVPFIGYETVGIIYLLGILLLSLFFTKGPVIFASLLFAVYWNAFFIPPLFVFEMSKKEDMALVALYVITAISTGVLVDRARAHKEMLQKNEAMTRLLYDVVKKMGSGPTTQEIFNSVKEELERFFKGKFEILVKQLGNGLKLDPSNQLLVNELEKNTARWVFENGKEAGWSTETLPSARNLYFPLKGLHRMVGVLVFKSETQKNLSLEEKNFIYTIIGQLTAYLERTFSEEEVKQHEQLKLIEKIHKTILEKISCEFSIPIARIQASAQMLKTRNPVSKEIHQIDEAAETLSKRLTHILAMVKLSEGIVTLNLSLQDIKELIHECCFNVKKGQKGHTLNIYIEDHLPLISLDVCLVEILLYHLLLNAFEYSPSGSTVKVEAKKSDSYIVISVADEGKGIPDDQLETIFEKFFRLPEETGSGMGLGLAIAKTIAEAHKGKLKVENLPARGAKFSLYLPVKI